MESVSSNKKEVYSSVEMMNGNVWFNRLDYEEAEFSCQLILNGLNKTKVQPSVIKEKQLSKSKDQESTLELQASLSKLTLNPSLSQQVVPKSLNHQECKQDIKLACELEKSEDEERQQAQVSMKDFNELKSALLSLTQTVNTLSQENQKLKNRLQNSESRVDKLVDKLALAKVTNFNIRGIDEKVTAANKRLNKVEQKLSEKQKQHTNNTQPSSSINFEQMLSVCHRGNKTNLDMIRSLEKSQVEEKKKFDSAMDSLRSYLQHKDTIYSQNLDKLKTELELIVQNKTLCVEELKKTVVKHKQLGEDSHNILKKRIEQIEKEHGVGEMLSTFNSRSGSYASSLNSLHDEKVPKTTKTRYDFNMMSGDSSISLIGRESFPAFPVPVKANFSNDMSNDYNAYFQHQKNVPPPQPPVGSRVPSKSWYDSSTNLSSDESYKKHKEEEIVAASKSADSSVQYNELYSGLTLLLSRQPDNCLPLVQVREKYEQVVGKPFPINDRIRKTINKYCENIKSLGVTFNTTLFLLDPENPPLHLLLVHCLTILYDTKGFSASPKELLDILYLEHQSSVTKSKLTQLVEKYPDYLQKQKNGGIVLTIKARTIMLRRVITSFLLLKRNRQTKLCSLGNLIGRPFSLAHYDQIKMRNLLNSFGQNVIKISSGQDPVVELGPLGKFYIDMTALLESNAGAIMLECLKEKYKELYRRDLVFQKYGFSSVDGFVAMFPTSFRIYGYGNSRTLVLVKHTTSWHWVTRPDPDLKNVVALDCEMVAVLTHGGRMESCAARCTIVDHNLDVLYDKFFRPYERIVDYRTKYSGIRKENLENAISFKVARQEILKELKDRIVVGHSLMNDFQSLRLYWPESNRRDLAACQLLSKEVRSLKKLSEQYLSKEIQKGEHCSLEDAIASMELYKLVQEEWERGKMT